MTPKLTDQLRRVLEDCLNQFNNAVQVKIFNKFSICDPPHFDASGLLHSNRFYGGPRVSILVDECDVEEVNNDDQSTEDNRLPSMQHKTERDYDPYQRVLNVTTHNDTLYAYYYTNNQPDNIENMQELLEIDKNINVNRTGLEQQHKKVPAPAIVNNWNSLQSDFLIDEQTAQSMESLLNPIINGNLDNSTNIENRYCSSEQSEQQAHQQLHSSIELPVNLDANMTQLTCTPLNDTTNYDKNNSPAFLWQ